MAPPRALSRLRAVDFYKKIPSDLTEATLTGAWLSVAASVVMALLLVLELSAFLRVQTMSELSIDRGPGDELLKVRRMEGERAHRGRRRAVGGEREESAEGMGWD